VRQEEYEFVRIVNWVELDCDGGVGLLDGELVTHVWPAVRVAVGSRIVESGF
jgi:hypothetical protein